MFNNTQSKQQIIQNLEAASGILLSALAFILPLLYIGSLRDSSSLPRYILYGVASGIILSIILWQKIAEHKSPHIQKNLFYTIFVLLSWSWISLSWGIDPKNSLLELLQLTGAIIISLAISQITNFRILTFIIIFSVAGASIASAIGIAQYFNFNPLAYRQFAIPASTFTNPNIATTYIDLITPLAFALIFIAKNKTYKSLATISSILCLSFLLLSHSRGSWLALIFIVIGLLILVYKSLNFKKTFFSHVVQHKSYLIIALITPFILFFIPSSVTKQPIKSSQVTFDSSAEIRLHAYINSIPMIIDKPLTGTGYGSFKTAFRDYMFSTVPFSRVTEDKIYARLHSDFLQVFVELGIIAGLLFLYIYIILLQSCWRIIKQTSNKKIIFITSGLFLAIIANAIHAAVDFPFHKPSSALQFWIWLGIISAISIKITHINYFNVNRITAVIFIILGSIFSFYNYIYYQPYIQASKYRLIIENNMVLDGCDTAIKYADKMMDSFDADFRHQSLYVAVYSQCETGIKNKLFAMNRVLSYDKTNTRAYITRGTIYLQQQLPQKAIDDFLQVTRILPHRASGYIGLAYAALQNQNQPAAIKLLKHAVTIEPDNKITLKLLNQLQ